MYANRIPKHYPVQPLKDGEPAIDRASCERCRLSWDDGKVTSITPSPAGRCPFEFFHDDGDVKENEWTLTGAPVVARAKGEILADIQSGRVPPTVATFAELHDYVDANGYGGAFEADVEGSYAFDGSDEALNFWNRVQGEVDAWLRAGRPTGPFAPPARTCTIVDGSIEDEDGKGDGAYTLLDVTGTPDEVGLAIAAGLRDCDLVCGKVSLLDAGKDVFLTLRIKVQK